jgi:excinuclease UvrABC nuclease subunit
MALITKNTLGLKGVSGTTYNFSIYEVNTEFKENHGGVYAFTKRTDNNGVINHTVIYIGKAVKFNQRFDSHEKWDAIKKAGGNCLCIYNVENESTMLKIETDLIRGQKPQLNVVHNS